MISAGRLSQVGSEGFTGEPGIGRRPRDVGEWILGEDKLQQFPRKPRPGEDRERLRKGKRRHGGNLSTAIRRALVFICICD